MKNQVIPRLWVGSWRDGLVCRDQSHFTVISVAEEAEHPAIRHFPLSDPGMKARDMTNFGDAVNEIHNVLSSKPGHVLVHCQSGVNRSPAVIIGYLMKYRQMSLVDAYSTVAAVRRPISPVDRQLALAIFVATGETVEKVDRTGFREPTYSEHEVLVNDIYREVLKRQVDPDGMLHYGRRLAAGDITPEALREILYKSHEYARRKAFGA